jgi:hypothetical protein
VASVLLAWHRGGSACPAGVVFDPPRRASLVLDADGWRFSRRSSSMDISALYAAVFAVYAAVTSMPAEMAELTIY